MRTLSILQPYAWLIVNGHKDIENRTWATGYRGRILVHAGRKYGPRIHAEYAEDMADFFGITLPRYEDMQTGGIVGAVDIVDCVRNSASKWFNGPYGFALANARPLPFFPVRGQLGFFNVVIDGEQRGKEAA